MGAMDQTVELSIDFLSGVVWIEQQERIGR
jgi:hypothetical protein